METAQTEVKKKMYMVLYSEKYNEILLMSIEPDNDKAETLVSDEFGPEFLTLTAAGVGLVFISDWIFLGTELMGVEEPKTESVTLKVGKREIITQHIPDDTIPF